MYSVVVNKKAKKELDKIPTLYARKIAEAIYSLANEPRPSGCKKLVGYNDIYRIRIASYRIIYTIQDDVLIVQVIKIGSRQSVYE
jgi:mRNA interferase RelE/StbE